MITGPKKYQLYWTKWKQGLLTVDDGLDLFQFLLDTDQCWDDTDSANLAGYLLAEGFLYYVYSGD